MNQLLNRLRTPCYAVDIDILEQNLKILGGIRDATGCRILLALKGFAMWGAFPLIKKYLTGASASSLFEARLAAEEMGGEVHTVAPAFRDDEFDHILALSDHIIFNSFSQWRRFRERISRAERKVSSGLRVNPTRSEVKVRMYDPATPCSRLGVTPHEFREEDLDGIAGLHFHTLCELGADALERTLNAFERHFGRYLERMEWVNFGGGHHITRPGYDTSLLCSLINYYRSRYGVTVYLEPGEAIALNAGVLISSVLDVVRNDIKIAVLDTSASAHMPDVLEMPYRPLVKGAAGSGEYQYNYRLGGITCLAGDVIGDYSFSAPLEIGRRLVFQDMAHYTMVKNTGFNGLRLPDIVLYSSKEKKILSVREFGYGDYKNRLS